jgi:hypothetical protein
MLVMHQDPQINRVCAKAGSNGAGFRLLVHKSQVSPGFTVI